MSYCRKEGKDVIIFATQEDHSTPSTVKLPEIPPAPGLIADDGSINWGCPCLGGMATGPCGIPFRNAFSCFHYSTAEPKGTDCVEQFSAMQTCMQNYPTVYNQHEEEDTDYGLGEAKNLTAVEESSKNVMKAK